MAKHAEFGKLLDSAEFCSNKMAISVSNILDTLATSHFLFLLTPLISPSLYFLHDPCLWRLPATAGYSLSNFIYYTNVRSAAPRINRSDRALQNLLYYRTKFCTSCFLG
jgi:hypothetical protein